MTAPVLRDPLTGTTLALDLVSVDLELGALLPTVAQEAGIPVNNTRTRMPSALVLQALATDLPGVGAVRADLEGQIEAWASSATRLQFIMDNVPVVSDLIIGSRGLSISDTTSGNWSWVLQEVREVSASVGAVAFPRARAVKDELAKNEEGGEQAPKPVRRSASLQAAQSLGLAR